MDTRAPGGIDRASGDVVCDEIPAEGHRAWQDSLKGKLTPPITPEMTADDVDGTLQILGPDSGVITVRRQIPNRKRNGTTIDWRSELSKKSPVIVQRGELGRRTDAAPKRRAILVPLDGSAVAEQALPFAVQLATERGASIHLARVVPLATGNATSCDEGRTGVEAAYDYLQSIEARTPGVVQINVLTGRVVESLMKVVHARNITDVIITSRGHGSPESETLGSIAGDLVSCLDCPVMVVPPQ